VLGLLFSILVLFVMPHVHTSVIRSSQFRPISKFFFWLLVADVVILTWIGANVPEEPFVLIGRLGSVFWFGYFFVIVPVIGMIENKLLKLEI
jgi:ubiquinol-cytochrome c reductase cytochrome b subunit